MRFYTSRLMQLTGCMEKEICITFVDDPSIRKINLQYLHQDKPTNVISFPLQEGEFCEINPAMLGDIVISVDTAEKDARKGNYSFDEEVLILIIHGLLHLTGYNHENTSRAEARKMQKKERELFQLLTGSF